MRKLIGVLFAVAMAADAAQVDEVTSDASFLDSAANGGAIVYVDETGALVHVRISFDSMSSAVGQLYVGADVFNVADGDEIAVSLSVSRFSHIPLRLCAGDEERLAYLAVFPNRTSTVLMHALDSDFSIVDVRQTERKRMKSHMALRYSSLWNLSSYVRVIAYRADEYGRDGAKGIVVVDKAAGSEGKVTLANLPVKLPAGNYVLVHDDGVEKLLAHVSITTGGFTVILK